MNCNRETVGANVFCEHCQQAMEGFPVPSGTPVTIPSIPASAPVKRQATHLYASADEQLHIAQRTVRYLARCLIFTSILLILAVAALAHIAIFGLPAFLT